MKPTFYIMGAVLDLIGIVLIASPDLVPWAVRMAARLRVLEQSIENRLRRLLRIGPRGRIASLSATVTGGASVSAVVTRGLSPGASIEQQVAYLLRRDEDAQTTFNAFASRVERIERETPAQLNALRTELQSHVEDRVSQRLADLRAARLWGVAFLMAGLALGSVANLLR